MIASAPLPTLEAVLPTEAIDPPGPEDPAGSSCGTGMGSSAGGNILVDAGAGYPGEGAAV